uniref:Uncharacterized protein n=1 Tax=Rhinella marina erythrocytic-like virus TaxID=2859906 RepID=A0A8F6UAX7_9VIRU|nr:hypothetical protein RMELV051 [Rhinella marina erythrocytic-like virus]
MSLIIGSDINLPTMAIWSKSVYRFMFINAFTTDANFGIITLLNSNVIKHMINTFKKMEPISLLPEIKAAITTGFSEIIKDINPDIIDKFIKDKVNIKNIPDTQNINKVHKMDGSKLIMYALIMACVVLLSGIIQSSVNTPTLFLLSALAFAGILSTVTC